MDAVPDGHIYRCLPLTIANQASFEILCPVDFEVVWNGQMGVKPDLLFKFAERGFEGNITSHFGSGVLTFNVPYLFRTDQEGIGLWVRGPINEGWVGVRPLEGIVETWWLPFTFTMNWKLDVPYVPVTFRKGDPICALTPIDTRLLAAPQLTHEKLADQPTAFQRAHGEWVRSRSAYNASSRPPVESGAQGHYHKGIDHTGGGTDFHLTRLRFTVPDHPQESSS